MAEEIHLCCVHMEHWSDPHTDALHVQLNSTSAHKLMTSQLPHISMMSQSGHVSTTSQSEQDPDWQGVHRLQKLHRERLPHCRYIEFGLSVEVFDTVTLSDSVVVEEFVYCTVVCSAVVEMIH